jgi:hypothetical protein
MEFIPPKVVSENTFEEAKLEFIRLDKKYRSNKELPRQDLERNKQNTIETIADFEKSAQDKNNTSLQRKIAEKWRTSMMKMCKLSQKLKKSSQTTHIKLSWKQIRTFEDDPDSRHLKVLQMRLISCLEIWKKRDNVREVKNKKKRKRINQSSIILSTHNVSQALWKNKRSRGIKKTLRKIVHYNQSPKLILS